MRFADFTSRPDRLIASLLLLGVVVLLPLRKLAAQTEGDPDAGRKLAQTWCVNCHIVDASQRSGSSTGAPSFPAIAAMKTTTFMGLQAFLQTPHDRMPDLHLSRDEIDDIAAFVVSLKNNNREK
jgi:mono/diheme cytochrome c family protein